MTHLTFIAALLHIVVVRHFIMGLWALVLSSRMINTANSLLCSYFGTSKHCYSMTTLALLCWHIEITWTSQCIYLFGYLIICHVYRQEPVHLTMTCPPKEIRRLHLPHWPSTAVFNMRPNIGWGIWEVLVLVRRQSSFRTIIRFRVS